ncbi:MAG: T9SS type A sorting domain-containing protein [Paludibacter sp.]
MKKFNLIFLCLIFYQIGHTQNMYVLEKAGVQSNLTLSYIQKLTFSVGSMAVNSTVGNSKVYSLPNIQKVIFKSTFLNINQVVNESEKLSLFPNPVTNILHVNYLPEFEKTIQIEIISIDGKIIYKKIINYMLDQFPFAIDVTSIQKGLYFCRLLDNKIIVTNKFIKN